jgi:protein arginine N-methyltransferase 1
MYVGNHFLYSISTFGHMIADRVRVDANKEALRRSIFPGAVVVEIGAGAGFFSMVACQLGARRVYAIEPNDSIALAKEAAIENGFADRIHFINQVSIDVDLPEMADVLCSDLRGLLPFQGFHIPSIADARRRLLKPGGVQIPLRDYVSVALVGSGRHFEAEVGPWNPASDGFSWSAARRVIVNNWWRAELQLDDLLSPGTRLFTLEYATIEDPNVSGTVMLSPSRTGIAYGMAVSFEAELCEGVGFSTAPGCPRTIYSTPFFPFESPIPLLPSDQVTIDFRADLIGPNYVFTWKTSVNGVQRYIQSTVKRDLFSPRHLCQAAQSYQPALHLEGAQICWLLEQIDGRKTNSQLAAALQERFSAQYPSFQAALSKVVEVVARFCQSDADRATGNDRSRSGELQTKGSGS